MIDLIYVLASILFFWLMILSVAGCERLGRTGEVERAAETDQ